MKGNLWLVPVMLFSLHSSAGAAKWERVTGGAEFTLYVDAATIKPEGGRVRVWGLWDYPSPQDGEEQAHLRYRSQKMLWYADCSSSTLGLKTLLQYAGPLGTGNLVHDVTVAGYQMVDVVPGSIGETVHMVACKRTKR